MLKLIFVRHGETDSNKKGTYLGWTDKELNEEGIKQAHEAKRRLELMKIKPNAIYTSPLKRAARTAEILNESFCTELIYKDKLKERNFGIWDDLTYEEIVKGYPDEHARWVDDWCNYCIPKGESGLQVYERITGFIKELIQLRMQGVFVVVTHLGCIRMAVSYLLGLGPEGSWRFGADNGSITIVEVDDHGYSVLRKLNS